MIGTAVQHSTYGRGTVRATRYADLELHVRFDSGVERWVRREHVQVETPEPEQAAPPAAVLTPAAFRREKPRRIIETLRLGVVPDDCVEDFTFGRDAEIAELKAWLTASNESGKALIGGYGTGKTHLLNFVRSYALNEGYVVAFVEMDPAEAPFSRPKRVYHQLVSSLRFRPQPTATPHDFRRLIKAAFSKGLLQDHLYFEHLAANPSDDRLWEWIEGRILPPRPSSSDRRYAAVPGLYEYSIAANIYCHLLSTIGWAARQLGYKGLLLIFDEAETLYMRQSALNESRSYNFLDALIATARGEPALLQAPYTTSYDYALHASHVPFLYRRPSGLKLLFGFTYDAFSGSAELDALPQLSLDSLGDDAMEQVYDHIERLYVATYRLRREQIPTQEIRDLVSESIGPTRLRVKGFVEALDIVRFHPHESPYDVLV